MTRLPPELTFDLVKADEVLAAHKLETEGFPADELSPLEQFKFRQEHVPTLFIGAFISPSTSESRRTIVGFACATRSAQRTYTAASMKEHEPEGSSLCIHNVVVSNAYRRRGIAQTLVGQLVAKVRNDGLTKRVLLICHDNLRPLYAKAGFGYVGPSPIVLGSQQWIEMCLPLNKSTTNNDATLQKANSVVSPPSNTFDPSKTAVSSHLPPGLLEVLQQTNSSRKRSTARLLSSFAGGLNDLTKSSNGAKSNKYDILCPRNGCASTILRANIGQLVEKELPELELEEPAPSSLLTNLPPAGTAVSCWLVRPSPMLFENIGFSRSVGNTVASGKLKLLSCADCDLGPLGWCIESGSEFLLICPRVGYGA